MPNPDRTAYDDTKADRLRRINDSTRNVFNTYWPLMVLALVVVLVVALVIVGVVAVIPEGSTVTRGP